MLSRVREKLIEYLRNTYPQSLPRVRMELPEQSSSAPSTTTVARDSLAKTLDTAK